MSFARHQRLMRGYFHYKTESSLAPADLAAAAAAAAESDADILRARHEFVRDAQRDATAMTSSWEVRMAIKYYDRLHKEYALVDLSRHREGKIGLRWRTEAEVVAGKGQFECGNVTPSKHKGRSTSSSTSSSVKCAMREGLHSYEVNFAYTEHGNRKNELVKCRLCKRCAKKLPGYREKRLAKERTPREQGRRRHASDEEVEGEGRRGSKRRAREDRGQGADGAPCTAVSETSSSGTDSALDASTVTHSAATGSAPEREGAALLEVLSSGAAASAASGASAPPDATAPPVPSNVWSADAPKARTDEDDMHDYLGGLFM